MNVILASENQIEDIEMRTMYADTMIEIAKDNEEVIIMDADLMGCNGTRAFEKLYPDRVVNCGIQEANMIGTAAGMSLLGKIPFAHSFAAFAARRAYDQTFISAAYAKLNVKIIGSDPGVTAALNGGTHMPFEDMGIMRAIPGVVVMEPTDSTMLQNLLPQMADTYGVQYMRLLRKNAVKVYEAGSEFEIGKAVKLREGTDVTIIASGFCVALAIEASEILAKKNIQVRLLDIFTWKPLDEEAVLNAARDTGAIVTAENHNVVSGLGAAVAQVVTRNYPIPMEMIGVQDEFGEVGPVDYLAEHFKMTAKDIVESVMAILKRKEVQQ